MRLLSAILIAASAVHLTPGAGFAHHSSTGHLTALTLQGVVVDVQMIQPHSFIYLDVKAGGAVQRWALEGPGPLLIARRGLDRNFIKAGDELGVCGYPLRTDVLPALTSTTIPATRPLQAAVLTLPSGQKMVWSNYRHAKCGLDV